MGVNIDAGHEIPALRGEQCRVEACTGESNAMGSFRLQQTLVYFGELKGVTMPPSAEPPLPLSLPNAGMSSGDTHLPMSTVLVVDDNPQNVELVQAYLETLNCLVHVAVDGIDALEKVPKVKPDLIILDIMMPRMSGFEVCRRLKGDAKTREIPVLMVTALNELGDIERGVESGTDDFLTKPINKLELLTRVKSLLRVRHLKGELDRAIHYISDMENRPGEA
jgi:two-component system cell cycle response regulator